MPPLPPSCHIARGLGLIRSSLEPCLRNRCLILGIGNNLRGDDGFGPFVIQRLQGKTPLPLLDAGSAPENLLGPIRRLSPDHVIIVDAVCLDAPVGSLHWLQPHDLEHFGISTHAPSFDLFLSFIRHYNPDVRVNILGVVPAKMNLGDPMSQPVQNAARQLVEVICELAPPQPDANAGSNGLNEKKCTN